MSTDRPIWQWSAVETAVAIRMKRVSCVEVITAHADRLHAVNPTLNAVTVDLSKAALAQAKSADEALAGGWETGPLHGIPVTIKDNVDVKDQPTPNGVEALAGLIAPDDAPVVRNLKRAGAIIIGRTNTPEFSFRAFTDNPYRGLTLNPWDPDLSCGGSSGGAGASVVAGVGAIAQGSDIGGSLRFPANFCGAATIKPTVGRVPAFNPSAGEERPPLMQQMSVQGPITRTIADARLGLEAMSRYDPRDPWWVPAPIEGERILPPIRVAVTKQDYGYSIHPAVAAAVDRAAGILAAAGYEVEEVDPPDLAPVMKSWRDLLGTEMKLMMDAMIREHGSDAMNGVVDGYYRMAELRGHEGYMRELAKRAAYLRSWTQFLDDYPLVLTPATLQPSFVVNEDLEGADKVREIFDKSIYISSLNLLGLPVAMAPVALHGTAPIGVQLIGRRYREDVCLDAAQVIENEIGVFSEKLWERENL